MQLEITGYPLCAMKDRQIINSMRRYGTVRKIVRNKFGVKVIVTVPKRYAKNVVPGGCVSRPTQESTIPKSYGRPKKKYCQSDHPRNLGEVLIDDDDNNSDECVGYDDFFPFDDLWMDLESSSSEEDDFP